MKKIAIPSQLIILLLLLVTSCNQKNSDEKSFPGEDLTFPALAQTWDEAMPLGNGMVGNLIWEKNGKLRFSLDRADLWDLRPMEGMDFDKWTFNSVYKHWKEDKYDVVQKEFDSAYSKVAAPSKIPGGALEFDIEKLGKIKEVRLGIETATCIVEWENGVKLTTFVHAEKPLGWYRFENLPEELDIELISPAYNRESEEGHTSQSRNDLNELGYEQGEISKGDHSYTYNQKGWGSFAYQIHTSWEEKGNELCGCWSVSSEFEDWDKMPEATEIVTKELDNGFYSSFDIHKNWWSDYWAQSAVQIPDSLLQKQYYLEMYKFGAAAREDAPPISLQAVWTADHGKLPPWKGDFHHDLNTQLSYWPSYSGNYLGLEEGFLNWLWKYRANFKKYTKAYFGVDGMNVPGVTTLEGEAMGGWIQYSYGQTVASWLGHHFYLHWKYTMNREFLETRAYPWMKDVAIFLDNVSVKTDEGKRKLLISSSPEIYNNSKKAWFAETTNFDLALIRWTYEKAAELARELNFEEDARKWEKILAEWPELAVDPETGLMFAPGFPYDESHRHFSHQMAYHPLGLLDFSKGDADKKVIQNTLDNLEKEGSSQWVGYSFSWQGNLYARAFEGDKAANTLRTFAECFCLKNSFHVNGDQCKAGHSNFTYRPFTLEGNFAFASAIQEMLMQSHSGVIKVFPAIPFEWKDCSFDQLRTYGAFLVSAEKKDGTVEQVKITSEKGQQCLLENPWPDKKVIVESNLSASKQMAGKMLKIDTKAGESLKFKPIN
ncbi:hypothetical protein OU798_03350 [Prolixibacteraceae bacterium Z1-6]|uniref:Glycosyl hydrolase family 95 N-terminal domain-containing protein n=1 Tax=Draconibacterium aestuarii TaxID=2998507 RepID=A0A9X3FAK7_9BACT|nr:hypothetical protein [Prolixibacteraceae bacterium Z1-6]